MPVLQVAVPTRLRWPPGLLGVSGLPPKLASPPSSSVAQLGSAHTSVEVNFLATLHEVDWSHVCVVVECAPEDLQVKRNLFAQLDRLVPAHVPIGSNSSGLPISRISEECATAERMANAHFFLPAHLVPLVELAKGTRTSAETMQQLRSICRK